MGAKACRDIHVMMVIKLSFNNTAVTSSKSNYPATRYCASAGTCTVGLMAVLKLLSVCIDHGPEMARIKLTCTHILQPSCDENAAEAPQGNWPRKWLWTSS